MDRHGQTELFLSLFLNCFIVLQYMLNKCKTLFCSARNFNCCSMPTYDNGSFPSPPPFSQWGPLFFLSLTPGGGRKREEPKAKAAAAATDPSSSATAERGEEGNPLPIVVSLWGEGRKRLRSPWCSRKERGKRCYSAVAFIPCHGKKEHQRDRLLLLFSPYTVAVV